MAVERFEPDVRQIMSYAFSIADFVGTKWIHARLVKEQSKKPPKDLSKHSYLYVPPVHPLIALILDFERWRAECIRTKRFALNEGVIKLAVLGRSMQATQNQKHFGRVVGRLRLDRQFLSAAFELEVAASYVARGWTVDFVEEGQNRTPDLMVTRPDGSVFWVECKTRERMTERDAQLYSAWTGIEQTLLRHLGPNKLNFMVAVRALDDPKPEDVQYIANLVLDAVQAGGHAQHIESGGPPVARLEPSGRFEILVQFLSAPDAEIEASEFGMSTSQNPDRVTMVAEVRRQEDGRTFLRNPKSFAFMTVNPPDRVTGVVSALREARKQLPNSGPGVVWIRVPDNAWGEQLGASFERAELLIRQQLSGGHNRRVNAVIVMTRCFERMEKDELAGLGYRPLTLQVLHVNPRTPGPPE